MKRAVHLHLLSFTLLHFVCFWFTDFPSHTTWFFFFKGSGAHRDLPSSPPRPFPDLRAASNMDASGEELKTAPPFGAHVSRVDPAICRRHGAHRHQGIGVDPGAGRSTQRTGHSQ